MPPHINLPHNHPFSIRFSKSLHLSEDVSQQSYPSHPLLPPFIPNLTATADHESCSCFPWYSIYCSCLSPTSFTLYSLALFFAIIFSLASSFAFAFYNASISTLHPYHLRFYPGFFTRNGVLRHPTSPVPFSLRRGLCHDSTPIHHAQPLVDSLLIRHPLAAVVFALVKITFRVLPSKAGVDSSLTK
jgi:hypothetical protein